MPTKSYSAPEARVRALLMGNKPPVRLTQAELADVLTKGGFTTVERMEIRHMVRDNDIVVTDR